MTGGRSASARHIVLVLALLVLPRLSAAANWTYSSSDHFEIYTTTGARSAGETLAQFERIRAFFEQHLELTPPPGRPIRLILFANEREFRPYRINEAVVAYYRPAPDRDYIVMQPLGRRSHAVVVHEYVHLILNRSGGRYPVWLNEGLAEYFATMPSAGGSVPVGRVSRSRLRGLGRDRRLVPLERLFAVRHDSPEYQDANAGGAFYAQSWALAHMLLSHDRYRGGFDQFLALVGRGTPSDRALTQVYGRPLAEVSNDLDTYVRGDRFPVRSVRFREPARAEVATREVPPFEAALVAANLLAAAHEDADKARAAFEELAREHADDLALLESRAALEIRTRRLQAAVPYLRRSVEVGSVNPDTYRSLAALTAEQDRDDAERLLERSLELDPTSVQSRVGLARLVGMRSAAEALVVLEAAAPDSPIEAYDVLRLRASAYIALGDLSRAHDTARELVTVSRVGRRRDAAARLLATVEAQLAAREDSAAP